MALFQTRQGILKYEDVGAGPAVLLIHGFTNYGLSWMPQLKGPGSVRLSCNRSGSPRTWRILAPAPSVRTVPKLAQDMIDLLEYLGISRVLTCGLSLGGMIALQMAIDHPILHAGTVIANSLSSFRGPECETMVNAWMGLLLQENCPQYGWNLLKRGG